MMSLSRMRYELRLLGIGAVLLPLGIVAIYLGFSLMVRVGTLRQGGSPDWADYQMARGLLALLENGCSLAAGLLAAAVVHPDPMLETHLSLPTSYRATMCWRLGAMSVWALAVAAATAWIVVGTDHWIVPVDQPLAQLTWLTPILWYIGLGALLTLLLRSRVASSAILGMAWIAQFLFKNTFLHSQTLVRVYPFLTEELIPGITRANAPLWYAAWVQNRFILLAMAMAMLTVASVLLGRNEALLSAES